MKKRILFLCPYPFDTAGSQRFRHELYLDLIINQGVEYVIHPFWSTNGWALLNKKGKMMFKFIEIVKSFFKRLLLLFELKNFDLIYIHRESVVLGPPWFEWFIFSFHPNTKIIYDFDDAIWMPDREDEKFWIRLIKWRSKINYIIRRSDLILAGNNYLKEYAETINSKVALFPTVVDTELFKSDYKNDLSIKPIVGWTGTHSTLRYLIEIIPQLEKAYQDHPFQLRVICDVQPEFSFPELEYIKWSKNSEVQDLKGITIGIMPMPDNPWTRGKCGFKAIQYLSLGIPTLASAVGVNIDLLKDKKSGDLVWKSDEWAVVLGEWLSRRHTLNSCSIAARNTILHGYSKQSQSDFFIENVISLVSNKEASSHKIPSSAMRQR